jgi:hypothetical protein
LVPTLHLTGHQHLQEQKHLIFTNQQHPGTTQIHGRITLQASHQPKDVSMKSIRTTLIATALMAGLTGLALAQNTTAPADNARAGRMEKMREHKAERHTQHLTELKAKLNLQGAQEPAWSSFTQSLQHPAHTARPERASLEKMTTPERLDQMQAMKAQRDAHMQQRAEATKVFYASLNAMKYQGGHGHH